MSTKEGGIATKAGEAGMTDGGFFRRYTRRKPPLYRVKTAAIPRENFQYTGNLRAI